MVRMIDPDQNGELDLNEWLNFMQATDESVEHQDWDDALNLVGKVSPRTSPWCRCCDTSL
eukprot:SAG11_NODE_3088_length_2703_cov_1.540707_2_plen_60_part_00